MTNRISRLKTALFANTREISLERAMLYTASHRQTEGGTRGGQCLWGQQTGDCYSVSPGDPW